MISRLWGWIAGAAGLLVVVFMIANAKRHVKKRDKADKDVRWLEQNRTNTRQAVKAAEVAHAKVIVESEKVHVIKQQTAKRIEKIQQSGNDVDALLDQLNSL